MSYEGVEEYLCARGHYQVVQNYGQQPTVCGIHGCKERVEWHHSIDQTNGYYAEDPRTFRAPLVEDGWDDVPMTDHYGTAYFVKNIRWKPAPGSGWEKVPTEEEIAKWEAEWERTKSIFAEPADKHRIYSGETLLFATASAEECRVKYEEFLSQGLPELTEYGPANKAFGWPGEDESL